MTRRAWNGKGRFIYLVAGSKFEVNRAPLAGIFPDGTEITYRPHIDIRTVDGSCVPWIASLLAHDWEVTEATKQRAKIAPKTAAAHDVFTKTGSEPGGY